MKLTERLAQVWPLAEERTRFRLVMLLVRKPRINRPIFRVTIAERCARCGNLLGMDGQDGRGQSLDRAVAARFAHQGTRPE